MIDLAAPALKQLSHEQQLAFVKILTTIATSDNFVSRFEWVLISVVKKHLANNQVQKITKKSNKKIRSLSNDIVVVLSTLAYGGAENQEQANWAFDHAIRGMGLKDQNICDIKNCSMERVHQSLERVQLLRFVDKEKFLRACEACVEHDAHVTVAEAETIRAIGDVLDCPIPMFG